MKLFFYVLIGAFFVFSLLTNCKKNDNESDKKAPAFGYTEKRIESDLPEGYPEEVTLPEGISADDIQSGTGRTPTPGGVNDKVYKVYVIYKEHPKNYKQILKHYKQLFTKENHWQGRWDNGDPSIVNGSFKKNNIHLEVEICRNYFSLKIKVYDNNIS